MNISVFAGDLIFLRLWIWLHDIRCRLALEREIFCISFLKLVINCNRQWKTPGFWKSFVEQILYSRSSSSSRSSRKEGREKQNGKLLLCRSERDGGITGSTGFHTKVHGFDASDVFHGCSVGDGDLLPHNKSVATRACEDARSPATAASYTARRGNLGGTGGLQWLRPPEASTYGHQSSDLWCFAVQVIPFSVLHSSPWFLKQQQHHHQPSSCLAYLLSFSSLAPMNECRVIRFSSRVMLPHQTFSQ